MNFFCKSMIFCLVVLSANQSNAQNERLRFEHIGFEEGISNENVLNILQDSKGYVWFGTMDGLNKYDGYSFTKYQFDPFDSTSLSQNIINTMWEDQYGFIWIGTSEGLCRFDRTIEKFTRYKPDPNAKFSDPNISAVNEDRDGMMWVGSFSSGLCRFDRRQGMFLPDSFELNGVSTMYKDPSGILWIGNSTGLYSLNLTDKETGKLPTVSFTHYQHNRDNLNSLSGNNVSSIFEDRQGILWITTGNGLDSYDRKTGIFNRYQNDPKNSHSISSNSTLWAGGLITEDREGNLWIATDNGLNKLNPGRTSFTSYFHNPNDPYSLNTNIVIYLYIDKADVLYAACWGGKLNKADLNPKPFGLIRRDPNSVNSLSSNAVTSILEDSSGIIWIGTYGGGLNRWDKKNAQFTHFRYNLNNTKTLRSDTILALLEDRHGHVWVCNGDVLSKLNKQTREFTHHYSNVKNYRSDHERLIFSITEDREGFLWLGTGNGLKRFDEKNGAFQHHYYNPANPNGISDYTAITVFADSRDNIWVGYGSRATDRYNKRTGRFTRYKHNPKDSTSISSNVVKSVFEDSEGNIWLGTLGGGLCFFDYQTEKFRTFTNKHGLPDNNVYSIGEDNNKHLWLGTHNGLSRFDPVTKTFTNYDYKDGLQGNVFTSGDNSDMDRGTCFKGKEGTLYFGGNNGFNFFDPAQIKAHSYLAPIVITQFKLFDKPVKGATELKGLVLKHNQNYFSFEFSSLSYYNPSKNQYAYRLEGVDEGWIYSDQRRYAAYTNIDPGTYTFKVKGTNNDGVWNEKGTSISLIINPPWWNTWPFKIGAALCLVGSFYGLIRWRIHEKFKQRLQQSKKEKQVAELQQQKTELEMQALRAQMNPHFIFNCLSSINRFILKNESESASDYLTKFSRLIRMVLTNSKQTLITLDDELEMLRLYLEMERLRFKYSFDYNISFKNEINPENIFIPPLLLQPFAENAIWHGLMNKEGQGYLSVLLSKENNIISCLIEDNGVGRAKAAELKSKSAEKKKSLGLEITKERLALLNGDSNETAFFEVEDLYDSKGNAIGTRVILKIKLSERLEQHSLIP